MTNPKLIDGNCSNLEVGESICLGYVGEDCSTIYVVEAGDVCEKIASMNGVDMSVMLTNNPQLANACDSNIYTGEVCVFFSPILFQLN